MKFKTIVLPSLALGAAGMLLAPAPDSHGFSTIGGSLGTGQRDFRTFNNFTDSTANDNQTPDDQFPGHQGAVMAIWKACIEWNSGIHGDGTGDPSQAVIGSGGANFDANFQGEANGVGSTNNNIHSALSGGSGGVLAFTETPISNGWRIRYYESWIWQDGPQSPTFNQIDLQGVACHEYGHALGLGHTTVSGSTMTSFISGTGVSQRSIATDDINGVQFIYGSKSGTKPTITNVSVNGSLVTITGTQFSASNNQVWFTNGSTTATGLDPKVVVAGLSSAGGVINVTIPAGAGDGDIMVQKNASGNSSLSNSWPVDLGGGGGPGGLSITSVTPSTIDALNVGTSQFVTITGTGFSPTTTIEINGVPVAGIPSPYSVIGSTTITLDPPNATALGNATLTVKEGSDSDSTTITFVANDPPALQGGTGDEPVSVFSFAGLDVTAAGGPSDTFFLFASLDEIPSVVPGFFSLAIGNNLTSLLHLATLNLDSVGLATLNVPIPSAPGVTFWIEGITFDGSFPLPDTNHQEVDILF